MDLKIEKIDWLFIFMSLIVGIMAEESFFRGQIGISYIAFVVVLYSIVFYRFRSNTFSHQRFGYLVLICIWLLAISYYLFDTELFHVLNIIAIPALVIFHLTLITSPQKTAWNNLSFIFHAVRRLFEGIGYSGRFIKYLTSRMKQRTNKKHYDVWMKVLIGVIISVPILFIILTLLISADSQFERLIGNIPTLLTVRADYIIRFFIILFSAFIFFGFMEVLSRKKAYHIQENAKPIVMDGIITLTILVLLDLVYLLFVVVQFKYFFSGTLEGDFTYAEYARRGFFELLFATLINLSVTTAVIQFTKNVQGALKKVISTALTILVLSSGVLLISAFMRLTMYENAYGFTITRVLAHSFMIFLMIIFAYTLLKIWLEKLSLFHFYFIASLIYYVGMNVVNLNKIVVDQNINRFEQTGKIDVHYLNSLSATGVIGLIDLYEIDPHVPELEEVLKQRKEDRSFIKSDTWQSENFIRNKAYERLSDLKFK